MAPFGDRRGDLQGMLRLTIEARREKALELIAAGMPQRRSAVTGTPSWSRLDVRDASPGGIPVIPFQLYRRIPLLGRTFHQGDRAIEERDQTAAERDAAITERDGLTVERNRAAAERDALEESLKSASRERDQTLAAVRRLNEEMRSAWLRHRPPELLTWQRATVKTAQQVDGSNLVRRIVAAYRAATKTGLGSLESLWFTSHADPKRPIHDALMREDHDEITRILRAPGLSALFYGFETLVTPGMYPSDPTDFWD
jgi:hypothetical protein